LRSREYESQGAKVRTYDIVASSIINLGAGQRNTAVPEEAAAADVFDRDGYSFEVVHKS
jgi:hypothetical protein